MMTMYKKHNAFSYNSLKKKQFINRDSLVPLQFYYMHKFKYVLSHIIYRISLFF